MSTFELMAAMDLRSGRAVRLAQGDFGRETVYGTDPLDTAGALTSTGVGWLHVVDLDAARTGTLQQQDVITSVIRQTSGRASCQIAGGIRTQEAAAAAFREGAARVVVGTAGIEDPRFAGDLVTRFGADRIACAIDVREGRALGAGWISGVASAPAIPSAVALAEAGVRRFVVTAIERDGMLRGPDLRLLDQFVKLDLGQVVASGGVSSIPDLFAVRDIGCAGAIVGRAVYEGRLDLAEAVRSLAVQA